MTYCIAGIGSRKTPSPVRELMVWIGMWCRLHGVWVRSGHAAGADYAFEVGAQNKCIAYVPWHSFNSDHPWVGGFRMTWDEVDLKVREQAMSSVNVFHPAPDRLKRVVKLLMARNYFQIMGSKEMPKPVDAVVCWTPEGKGGGGTGQAIRMANYYNVPVLDLGGTDGLFLPSHKTIVEWLKAAFHPPTND